MRDWHLNVCYETTCGPTDGRWRVTSGRHVKKLEDHRYEIYTIGQLYFDDEPIRLTSAERILSGRSLPAIDGAGFLVIVDKLNGGICIVSDIMGFYPSFRSSCGKYFSNSADWIGGQIKSEVNPLAVTEMLMYGSVERDRTYYKDVERMPSATMVRIDHDNTSRLEWRYDTDSTRDADASDRDIRFWRESFREALASSIARVPSDKLCLFLSGGIDSALVASLVKGRSVTAITFTDKDRIEDVRAERTAEKHRIALVKVPRPPRYYTDIIPDAVSHTDGMFEYRHAYTAGLTDTIRDIQGAAPIISGCYFDIFVKGLSVRGEENWYDRIGQFNGEYREEVWADRRRAFECFRNDMKSLEKYRCLPMSGTRTIAYRTTLFNTLDFALLTSHRDIVRVFRDMPVAYKSKQFVAGMLDNNDTVAPKTSVRAAEFSTAIKRFLQGNPLTGPFAARAKQWRRERARRSSWIPTGEIIASETGAEVLKSYRSEIEILERLCRITGLTQAIGDNPDPMFFRVLTMAEWVRQNGR